MKEITNIFNNYRECSRHLWNAHFLPNKKNLNVMDMRDDFNKLDRQLFSSLVLAKIGKPPEERLIQEAFNYIRIVPITPTGIPVMISRPSKDGNKYWDDPVSHVGSSEAEFVFIQYFDWEQYDFLDFKYYMTRIISFSKHANLVGREALIETSYAKVFLYENSAG